MSDIIKFPKQEAPTMFGSVMGPEWHKVIIEGRSIPKMLVREWEGLVEVLFDGRWIYQFEDETAALHAAAFAAQALAVGSGYSHLGAPNKDRPFAPEVIEITT